MVSANVDDLRNQSTIRELDIRAANSKIGLVCIQETHEAIPTDQETENYRYISAAAQPINGKANEKGIGWAAVMVKKEWGNTITEIARYSHRCIKIKIQTNMKSKTLHLINTYAPHMRYGRQERDEYWREIKYILDTIPKNDIIIWAADNNGQIAKPNNNNDRGEEIHTNAHIGPWHYAPNSEKGNGGKLVKVLHKYELTATNTIHHPKDNDRRNLTTWTSGDGKIHKQLDYIIIGRNMKTWTNYSKVKGTANTNQTDQHNIICVGGQS